MPYKMKMTIDQNLSNGQFELTIQNEWEKVVIPCKTIEGASAVQDVLAENAWGIVVKKEKT